MPLFNFSIQIREDDVAVETSNSEHPRLYLNNTLRSQYKLDSILFLPSYSFNCSNIVSTLSVNHDCSVSHKQQRISVTNHDKNILTSNLNLNIINTASANLVTVVTSSGTPLLHHSCTTPPHFTSFTNYLPPLLLSNSIINVITIPPKIWRKKATTKFKPLIYDDVDEELYLFKPFGKCVNRSSTWNPLFFGRDLWIRLNSSETFALTSMLTLLFASQSSLSLNLTGILSVNEACHTESLTSNSY